MFFGSRVNELKGCLRVYVFTGMTLTSFIFQVIMENPLLTLVTRYFIKTHELDNNNNNYSSTSANSQGASGYTDGMTVLFVTLATSVSGITIT